MPSIRSLLLLLPILAVAASPASAEIVYDTYPFGPRNPDILVGDFEGNNLQYAFPFDVPVGGDDPRLEVVTLRLQKTGSPTAEFVFLLRMDAGGEPGAVLESWTFDQALPTETDIDLTSTVHPVLARGSTYWLNLKVTSGTGAGSWKAADDLTTDFLFANTDDLDPTWLVPQNSFPVGMVQVEVPEPGQALLALTGAAVLLGSARGRRAS